MSVRKLTVAGLCLQAAVTVTLIIVSGAGRSYYLLAAAYALTGLFFLKIVYTSVPSKELER